MLGILLLVLAFILFAVQRYYASLLIFFGFATNGFMCIPPAFILSGTSIDKTSDLCVLFILGILIYRFKTIVLIFKNESIFKWIMFFLLFIIIDTFYSLQILKYDTVGVIRVFRHNLIFLSLGVFFMVPKSELLRVWHTVAVITVFQCILFLIQLPTGIVLLDATIKVTINNMESIGWVRYYNTPTFLIPALFYFLFMYKSKRKWLQWLVVGLLITTEIAPMHRSHILTVALVASIYVLSKQSNFQRIVYLALLIVVGVGALSINSVNTRVLGGVEDLENTFYAKRSLSDLDYNQEDTFAYRMAHLAERANYISREVGSCIFGVGLLSEDTPQAKKLPFEAGLFNDRIGRKSQVETSDIVWSLLILYMGFVGTAIFIALSLKYLLLFYRNRYVNISVVGLLTLSTVLLLSFTSTELVQIHFRIITTLFLVAMLKTSKVKLKDTITNDKEDIIATINLSSVPYPLSIT
ncbi:hypothetical protein [Spirosoma koreense]